MKCYGHEHELSCVLENNTNSMAYFSAYLFIFSVYVHALMIFFSFLCVFLSFGKCFDCQVIHSGESKMGPFRDSLLSVKWHPCVYFLH